ncbi:MAG TPA: hypothetical protein VKU82_08580 [Planctomycetaceae bacterium]|nr:hypothetical protein [Planctomycetaceae bacterium]
MLRSAVRAGSRCLVAASLMLLSGCAGVCWSCGNGGCHTIFDHPAPACYGLKYEGRCTCRDDIRDRINQVSDILLP